MEWNVVVVRAGSLSLAADAQVVRRTDEEMWVGLDTVEILWAAEDTFRVSISDAQAAECMTVGDLNHCIARLVAERATVASGRPISPEPELTWPMLVAIIERISGILRSKVKADAKWREDLGIN